MLNKYARDNFHSDFSIKGWGEWRCRHSSVKSVLENPDLIFDWDPGFYRAGHTFVSREASRSANSAVSRLLHTHSSSLSAEMFVHALKACITNASSSIRTCGGGSLVAWELLKPCIASNDNSVLHQLLHEYVAKYIIPLDIQNATFISRHRFRQLASALAQFYDKSYPDSKRDSDVTPSLEEARDFVDIAGTLGWNSSARAEILRRLTLSSVGFMGSAIEWALIDSATLNERSVNVRRLSLESLRLHSPAWRLGRTVSTSRLERIPAGHEILLNIYAANRDEDVFKHPKEFHPERWANSRRIPRDLLSFGAGDRVCPARSFSIDLIALVFEAAKSVNVTYRRLPFQRDEVGTVSSPPKGVLHFDFSD